MTCIGQEWQFHMSTDVVKTVNFTLLLLMTCSGQEWQFHMSTDI